MESIMSHDHAEAIKKALSQAASDAQTHTIAAAHQLEEERAGAVYDVPAVVRVHPWGNEEV
jgi:predicted esterase